MRLASVKNAVVVLALLTASGVASADSLHGFCVPATPTCSDNGAVTPVPTNLPTFGFGAANGPLLGTDELAFLIPNNRDSSPSFTFSVKMVNGGPTNTTTATGTATLFSTTPWSSSLPKAQQQLDGYLGLSANPTNPIGAYVPGPPCNGGVNPPCDPGVASYFVYTVSFANTNILSQANESNGPIFSLSGLPSSLGGVLPLGSFILDFSTDANGDTTGTPNSAALEISGTPTPEPGTLLMLGTGLLGIAALVRRRITN